MPRYLDDGGWVPIHRALAAHLPRDRAYSEVEALVSLSIDLSLGRQLSERDYSRIWRWSRGKVKRFRNQVMGEPVTVGEEAVSGPDEVRYVAGLRRDAGHETGGPKRATNDTSDEPAEVSGDAQLRLVADRQQDHSRATTGDLDLEKKKKKKKKKKSAPAKPWSGLTRDLDALLGCRSFVLDLAQRSPVLSQWSIEEVQVWSRSMVQKGNSKRATRSKPPLVDFAGFLRNCARYAKPHERRPREGVRQATDLDAAVDAMGVEW